MLALAAAGQLLCGAAPTGTSSNHVLASPALSWKTNFWKNVTDVCPLLRGHSAMQVAIVHHSVLRLGNYSVDLAIHLHLDPSSLVSRF